tara:strand:- start:93 stop:344 length:252 start_codon:yes stop_codon:yes gene_type:complete
MQDITPNELNEYKVINTFVVKIKQSEYCFNSDDTVTATMHKRKDDRYLIVIYNLNKDGKYVSNNFKRLIHKNDVEFVKHIELF